MKTTALTIIGLDRYETVEVGYEKLREMARFRGGKLNAYKVYVDGELVGQVFQQQVTIDGPRVGRHVVTHRRTAVEWGFHPDVTKEFPFSSSSARSRADAVARLLGGSSAITVR